MKRKPRFVRASVCAVIGLGLALSDASFAGTVIYVNGATGSDSDTGQDWTAAKRTVQGGLDAAVAGDQVWVAAGMCMWSESRSSTGSSCTAGLGEARQN
jgi:hypothetical protein